MSESSLIPGVTYVLVPMTPTADGAPERSRRASPMPPDERREAILAAAIPLLRARGSAVTTRELADAACVAEGTLFRVFPDKGALLHAAIQRALDPAPVLAQLAGVEVDLPLRTKLRKVVAILHTHSADVAVLISASHELAGTSGTHGPPHGRPKGRPVEMVVRGVAAVLHPHADRLRLDPTVSARLLTGYVVLSATPFGGGPGPALTTDQIVELFLDGALARPSQEDPC